MGSAFGADQVRATEPVDGAVTGPRPIFCFTVSGEWDSSSRARIELSRDRFKTIERSWDMRDSQRGWTIFTEGAAGSRGGSLECPEMLPEGPWEWRLRVFSKDSETDAARPGSFRIDATPPAEVTGLRLERRPEDAVLLAWDPVLYDAEGRPETVDRYVIYRYDSRGIFSQARASEIGATRSLSFLDRTRAARATSLDHGVPGVSVSGRPTLYYKVVAVDAAGNELGRRGPADQKTPLR